MPTIVACVYEMYLHAHHKYTYIFNITLFFVVFCSLPGWFCSSVATAWQVSYSASVLAGVTFWVSEISLRHSFLPSCTAHRPANALLSILESSLYSHMPSPRILFFPESGALKNIWCLFRVPRMFALTSRLSLSPLTLIFFLKKEKKIPLVALLCKTGSDP